MAANQTECSRLEQRSAITFFGTEKYKPCEIYRRTCDMYGKSCFSQKDSLWKHSLFEKEKGLNTAVIKKVILTVFFDMKGPILIDFLEKDATVNSAS